MKFGRKKDGDGAEQAPKPKKVRRSAGEVIGGFFKSLIPEPKYISDGDWCCCCGSKDHKAKDCPKDPIGFYKPAMRMSRPKRGKGKKGDEAPAAPSEPPAAVA